MSVDTGESARPPESPEDVAHLVDRRTLLTDHLLGRLPALSAGVAALLVYMGIRFMHRQDPPPFLSSLPIGILARVFPNPWWVLVGTLVVLLGCGVAAFASVSFLEPRPAASEPIRYGSRVRGTRVPGIVLGLVGACVLGYVLSRAPGHQAGVSVLLGLFAAPVLLTVALDLLIPAPPSVVLSLYRRLSLAEWGIILITMTAFVALNERDAYNWRYAYIGDEWSFYDLAEAIAHGNPFDMLSQAGVYGIHPIANSAYQALVMRIFGINVFGWRMAATLSVALPIAPLFWLARQFGDTLFGLATVVFYAGCGLLWAFAHIGYNNNDPLLVSIPAAAFLYAGLRAERSSLLFAAGACGGFAWYSLFTGRLMIGVLVLVVLSEWAGGPRAAARRLVPLLAGFAVAAAPLAVDNGWDTIHQMFALTSLSQVRTSGPLSSLLAENTVRGIFAFLYATENSHYVVGEVFDTVSGAALCLGCVIALRRLPSLEARLILIWFLAGLMLTTPLYYAPQIADTRLQIVIPPAALLAAFGLRYTAQALQAATGVRSLSPIIMVAALSAAIWLNAYRFYVTLPQMLNEDVIALGIGALDAAPHDVVILTGNTANYNLCQVLDGYGKDFHTVLHFQGRGLQPQCVSSSPSPSRYPTAAMIVFDNDGRKAVASCRLPLRMLVESPNHARALWGYQFTIRVDPPATYARRLAESVAGRCPAASALRQS